MVNLQNKKRSAYSTVELAKLDASLSDYWDKSRALESELYLFVDLNSKSCYDASENSIP